MYTLAEPQHHFYRVYLWESLEAMQEQINHRCGAMHRPMVWFENPKTGARRVPPMLGDMHFVSGKWNEETVSHECCHAMFHFSDVKILVDVEEMDMTVEEQLCYFQGDLNKKIYRWLWKHDKE